MSGWAVVSALAVLARPGALESLRLDAPDRPEQPSRRRRSPTGCTADVEFILQRKAPDSLSVAEIRLLLLRRWSARRVNAILQRMVHRGDVRVTELGNPKRYQWTR